MSSSWLARCARQWMQEYVLWQWGKYAWNVFTMAALALPYRLPAVYAWKHRYITSKTRKNSIPEKARAIKHRRIRKMCRRKIEKNVQQQWDKLITCINQTAVTLIIKSNYSFLLLTSVRINQELSSNNGTTEKSLQNATFTRVTVKAVYLIDINNYVNDLGMVRLIFISQKYAYVSSRTVFLKLKDATRK